MIQDVIKDADGRMSKALDALRRDLTSVRTGRANPAILDRVMVEYYGTNSPINQVASISVPESRMLVIQPWDKGSIPAIEKAIMKSDLGVTPSNDGQVIRIALPQLTEERRKQMVKIVHQQTEDAKVSIRNVRRDAITNIKELMNEKIISENDERRGEHQVDELTKKFTDEAERIGKAKEAEVLEV
jgi:ribosome recycling factor